MERLAKKHEDRLSIQTNGEAMQHTTNILRMLKRRKPSNNIVQYLSLHHFKHQDCSEIKQLATESYIGTDKHSFEVAFN